jgi:hypothetical protein
MTKDGAKAKSNTDSGATEDTVQKPFRFLLLGSFKFWLPSNAFARLFGDRGKVWGR